MFARWAGSARAHAARREVAYTWRSCENPGTRAKGVGLHLVAHILIASSIRVSGYSNPYNASISVTTYNLSNWTHYDERGNGEDTDYK